MIPKILHQTYKSTSLPDNYRKFQEKLLFLHPDWEYKFWTDPDNEFFLRTYYPHFYKFYISIPIKIVKFDFIRYVYLYHFGGVYLDIDYEMLKPFDLLQYNLVLPRESDDYKPLYLGNSLLASIPKHPFWEYTINVLIKNIENISTYIDEEDVINISGPGLITRTYHSFKEKDKIYIPPREHFNPPIPKNNDEYKMIIDKHTSYGIHHCTGSWRALSKSQRILKKLKRILFPILHKN